MWPTAAELQPELPIALLRPEPVGRRGGDLLAFFRCPVCRVAGAGVGCGTRGRSGCRVGWAGSGGCLRGRWAGGAGYPVRAVGSCCRRVRTRVSRAAGSPGGARSRSRRAGRVSRAGMLISSRRSRCTLRRTRPWPSSMSVISWIQLEMAQAATPPTSIRCSRCGHRRADVEGPHHVWRPGSTPRCRCDAGTSVPPGVDVQVIPYLVVHAVPWWLAVSVLPVLRRRRHWRGVDHLADLAGEVLGGGPPEPDGEDDLVVAAA